MVHHLPLYGRKGEIAMHLFVLARSNACRRKPKCFHREIEPAVSDRSCFRMDVAPITIGATARSRSATSVKATHALPVRSCPRPWPVAG
jgi:hypothetical protein